MGTLKFLALLLALCIIIIIVPQTPTDNIILRTLFATGWFANYPQAKQLVSFITWGLVFAFLFLLILLNLHI